MNIDLKRTLIMGATLGVVAAVVVWWLERYQADLLTRKFQDYLRKHDDFRKYVGDE